MADTLKKRIARHIRTSGPLPVAEYMHWCMADREDGYYRNQVAIGRRGDFITAPEVSQMFGELISIWCRLVWEKLGKPKSLNLVELGPGRGVLMSDILRASKSSQQFADAISVHLVEIGEPMVEAQKEALSEYPGIQWHRTIKQVPQGPSIIIANEFLDVLPIRQFIKASGKWHERCVTINEEEKLDWCLGSGMLDESSLPDGHDSEPELPYFKHNAKALSPAPGCRPFSD